MREWQNDWIELLFSHFIILSLRVYFLNFRIFLTSSLSLPSKPEIMSATLEAFLYAIESFSIDNCVASLACAAAVCWAISDVSASLFSTFRVSILEEGSKPAALNVAFSSYINVIICETKSRFVLSDCFVIIFVFY